MNKKNNNPTVKHLPALAHGPLTKLFDNVWFVRGAMKMPMLMPMKISRSMTILKDGATDELTLVNSMRLSEAGLAELERLGKVVNVIRIGGFHGRDDGFYRERYGAKVFAIAGQSYTRKLGGNAKTKEYMQPDAWLNKDSVLPIQSATLKIFETANPPEAILVWQHEGGIAITGDSLQNTAGPDEYVNVPAKLMMRKMGFFKAHNVGPGWLQFAKPDAAEVRSILDLDFEHVLPGHGDAVIGKAKEKFRPILEGELPGCHKSDK